MATEVFILFLSSATEYNYSNSAVICGTGKGVRARKSAARGALLCQYAVRETRLWKRRDYLWRGRHNNGEVERLVEGIESDDIERVASWAVAGAANAFVEPDDVGAGAESYACACKRTDEKRQPQDSGAFLCLGNRSF